MTEKLEKVLKDAKNRETEIQKQLEYDISHKLESRQLISIDRDGKLYSGE